MSRFIKKIVVGLALVSLVTGLFSVNSEAKRRKTPTYNFGGVYRYYDKRFDEEFRLTMNQFSSPERGSKVVGYIDIDHRVDGEGKFLTDGVKRWKLKRVGKNKYKAKGIKITVYKKKVILSGKDAKEYGWAGTFKLKKRFIS